MSDWLNPLANKPTAIRFRSFINLSLSFRGRAICPILYHTFCNSYTQVAFADCPTCAIIIGMQNNMFYSWLQDRGITEKVIEDFGITVSEHSKLGEAITIPVLDTNGDFSFNKYRRNPMSDIKPKYVYDFGSKTSLYGWYKAKDEDKILITEGEMDTLVAWSKNIPAVSSTGGAKSFQNEWAELFSDKEVTLCFDNDNAGAEGMVKTLAIIPHAYIIFLPDRPGVKDVSDYVQSGGDLNKLMRTRVRFSSTQDIIDHRSTRLSLWQSVCFHDAFLESLQVQKKQGNNSQSSDELERAKAYPITDIMEFKQNKANCIWHNEKTPSMAYYPNTNSVYCFGCAKYGDAVAVYQQIHDCTFKEALKKLQ